MLIQKYQSTENFDGRDQTLHTLLSKLHEHNDFLKTKYAVALLKTVIRTRFTVCAELLSRIIIVSTNTNVKIHFYQEYSMLILSSYRNL